MDDIATNTDFTLENDRLREDLARKDAALRSALQVRQLWPPSIMKAIGAIRRELQPVQKTGDNTHFNFKYHSIEDVMSAVSPLMAEHGLIVFQTEAGISDAISEEGKLVAVAYDFTVGHEDGSVIPEKFRRTGICKAYAGKFDEQNKAGYDPLSINKCETQAEKYFLKRLFKITTAEDAKHHDIDGHGYDKSESSRPTTQPVAATAQQTGATEQVDATDGKRRPPRSISEWFRGKPPTMGEPRLITLADGHKNPPMGWLRLFGFAIMQAASRDQVDRWVALNAEQLEKLKTVTKDADGRSGAELTEYARQFVADAYAAYPKNDNETTQKSVDNPTVGQTETSKPLAVILYELAERDRKAAAEKAAADLAGGLDALATGAIQAAADPLVGDLGLVVDDVNLPVAELLRRACEQLNSAKNLTEYMELNRSVYGMNWVGQQENEAQKFTLDATAATVFSTLWEKETVAAIEDANDLDQLNHINQTMIERYTAHMTKYNAVKLNSVMASWRFHRDRIWKNVTLKSIETAKTLQELETIKNNLLTPYKDQIGTKDPAGWGAVVLPFQNKVKALRPPA